MKFKTPSFWYNRNAGYRDLRRALLTPLGLVWSWAVQRRFDMYFPVPLARPVVCVGNLVAGGAGKTPVVLSLVDLLKDAGHNPHILTRGYGGSEAGPIQVSPARDTAADVGDEALLLVDKAPTWVARNRPLGAQAAIDTGASLILMDDGFQNPAIYKDFSLVVVDGAAGFGNGEVFPAGPLREPVDFGLSRADAVVMLGEDKTNAAEDIARHAPDMPVYKAMVVPDAGNPDLRDRTVFAFAGIGRPEKFRDSLLAAGAKLEGWGSYPDHYSYTEEDLKELMDAAQKQDALVVTTAKDYMRLPASLKEKIKPFSIHIVWDDPEALLNHIDAALRKNFP